MCFEQGQRICNASSRNTSKALDERIRHAAHRRNDHDQRTRSLCFDYARNTRERIAILNGSAAKLEYGDVSGHLKNAARNFA